MRDVGSPHHYPRSLERGGECGEIVRRFAWESTALGPIEGWPGSLKTTVSTVLRSRHPMILWWGPELVQIYNDAFVPSFGRGKHPDGIGQRAADCWPEIWSVVGPQVDEVMQRGNSTWHVDQSVAVRRGAVMEEVYWTYGYSPVFDDRDEIGGTLVVCSETTPRVLAERRFATVRALVERLAPAMDALTVARIATEVFAESTTDIPFALVHLRDPRTDHVVLASSVGVTDDARPVLDQLVREQARAAHPGRAIGPLPIASAPTVLPGGPWPEPASELYIAPLAIDHDARMGSVTFGLSPRLTFDEAYRAHLDGIAAQLGTACAVVLDGAPTGLVRRRWR